MVTSIKTIRNRKANSYRWLHQKKKKKVCKQVGYNSIMRCSYYFFKWNGVHMKNVGSTSHTCTIIPALLVCIPFGTTIPTCFSTSNSCSLCACSIVYTGWSEDGWMATLCSNLKLILMTASYGIVISSPGPESFDWQSSQQCLGAPYYSQSHGKWMTKRGFHQEAGRRQNPTGTHM